jgi:putative FmdB family regulatory protein
MPIYEYQCGVCNYNFDMFKKIDTREEPTREACPKCGKKKVEMRICAPNLCDPTKMDGRMPVNVKLQEKFKQIHENTAGSRLNETSKITKI